MATVTPPSTRNLDQDRSRIRSPLARLRKYINSYVTLEGLGLVALFLALWFWIGLILDYGSFRAFTIDWVQELPWGFRLTVLLALILAIVAIVAFSVVIRLLKDFSEATLALVLERRFPKELGDRLITAVELSDPKEAAKLGFSPAMVRETIHEAADRVDHVPVKEVFDWKRLTTRALVIAILTLGAYLLAGAGFSAVRGIKGEQPALGGYGDLHDISTIYVERNLLLRNTIWPRRAYLEILPWETRADGTPVYDLSIPRDSAPGTLRVRAWKYVVADQSFGEGWRLLTWQDLRDRPRLGAGEVPELPAEWTPRDSSVGYTVDEVDLKLEAFPLRTSLPDGTELPARWCIADAQGEWQPLRWKDLTKDRIGMDVPALPAAWDPTVAAALAGLKGPGAAAALLAARSKNSNLTVDQVEKLLSARAEEPKKAVAPGQGQPTDKAVAAARAEEAKQLAPIRAVLQRLTLLASLRETLDRVDARCADRAMRRTMRKLIIPGVVTLVYRGQRTTNTSTLTPGADNEFTGTFGELKETVTFDVRGEDYITGRRTITVVDRPRLEKLESEEERPAYLYYRPAEDSTPAELRGKRQLFNPAPMSVSGEATSIEVPSGTALTLRATVTKPIVSVELGVDPKDARGLSVGKPAVTGERTFEMRIPEVRREQRFTLRFRDSDDVMAERRVVILPREDTGPRVRDFNPDEIIRKVKEGYMVSASCRIPFKGRVRDDHGLARVRYACRVIPADFLSEQKVQSLYAVGAVPLVTPGFGGLFQAAGMLLAANKQLMHGLGEESGPEQFIDLPAFLQAVKEHRPGKRIEQLPMDDIRSMLREKQSEPFRKLFADFSIEPDKWMSFLHPDEDATNPSRWVRAQDQRAPAGSDLPLWLLRWRDRDGKELPIKETDVARPQRRFFIEVRLIAEDTFLEGEIDPKSKQPIPHISPSGETFTFVVVPENELLSKIAEEEETKYREMVKAHKPVADNLDRMRDIKFALSSSGLTATDLNTFIARCDTLAEGLKTAHQEVKGVYTTYERILKEMRANQVNDAMINKVFKGIYTPLSRVAETQFDRTIAEVQQLRRSLDNPTESVQERVKVAAPRSSSAHKQLNDLKSSMDAILSAMEGLSKINELIAELARIEKQEQDLENIIRMRRQEELRKLLGDEK